jgi:hypothetical protein
LKQLNLSPEINAAPLHTSGTDSTSHIHEQIEPDDTTRFMNIGLCNNLKVPDSKPKRYTILHQAALDVVKYASEADVHVYKVALLELRAVLDRLQVQPQGNNLTNLLVELP